MSNPTIFRRRLFRFDMVLFASVLVLAFFLGSFAANNTDFFLHLGLGNPWTDIGQSHWVHHAWLTSWLLEKIYQPFSPTAATGGVIAVTAKALVVVCLAAVLCLIRRRGQEWLLPITCTALALLVTSTRLLFQPQVVSLFFLAVTLWVLTLPPVLNPRAVWCLPALFAVWVNMDQWFVLGPLTVGLWLVGEGLQGRLRVPAAAPDVVPSGRLKTLAFVLVVGLVCCLVNPWFYRAFTLPMELAYLLRNVLPAEMVPAGRMVSKIWESDPLFLPALSPFSPEYYSRPSFGQNAAGLAYFVLLALGIASFALPGLFLEQKRDEAGIGEESRGRWNLPLLAVFTVFALLSAWSIRLIPLFGVVGGPIAALNLQDYVRRRRGDQDAVTQGITTWAIATRIAALAACLVLLVCAWPGWLHGNADNWRYTHHVGWDVAEDPGIREAAKVIRQVQQQTGLCKLGFNYSLDGGNLFAWCRTHGEPTVELFCDSRLALPPDRAEAYGKIRKALRDEADFVFGPPQPLLPPKVRQGRELYQRLLREQGIDYMVFTGLHFDQQTIKVAESLMADLFRQWVLIYHDGRTAVFGWLDPANQKPNNAYRKMRLDVYSLASSATLPPNLPRVELDAGRVAPPPTVSSGDWDRYLFGPTRPALSSFQSSHLLTLAKLAAADWQRANIDLLTAGCGTGLTVASGLAIKGPVVSRKNPQGQVTSEPLFRANDRWPAGALVSAVRAGRQATLENPNDVNAYISLGQAYQMCQQEEDYWVRRPSLRPRQLYKPDLRIQFRLVQIVNALQTALAIQPDNFQIHESLHDLFLNMGYLDLALTHLIAARKGLDVQKPASKEQAQALEKLKDKYDQRIKGLSTEVKHRKEGFDLATGERQNALERFQVAMVEDKRDAQGREQRGARGLVELGLKLLLEANAEALTEEPAKLRMLATWQLFLLTTTGQAREADQRLESETKWLRSLLAGGEYEELRALAAAALGDYPAADKFLDQAEQARHLPPIEQILEEQQKATRQLTEYLAAVAGWMPGREGLIGPLARLGVFHQRRAEIVDRMMAGAKERRDVAELRLIRGSLALESGDTAAAAKHFRRSMAMLPLALPLALDFPDRPIGQRCLELLKVSQ